MGKGVLNSHASMPKMESHPENLEKGDIVLRAYSNAPRGSWMLAQVIEATPDSRGFVRSVKLKTKTRILERPINKLCVLVPHSG